MPLKAEGPKNQFLQSINKLVLGFQNLDNNGFPKKRQK